jgi:hypothetical protein
LDLKKASDTIDHVILNTIGMRGAPAELLKNYLTNCLQTICVNGECDSLFPVSVGVPQGSVLGPLLFLIYINEIGSLRLRGSVRLFADDTATILSMCGGDGVGGECSGRSHKGETLFYH